MDFVMYPSTWKDIVQQLLENLNLEINFRQQTIAE
jgi:hypothetical protein